MRRFPETDFGYTGQRSLNDMGLMDYRARFYDPTIGRFIQPDSIIPSYAYPQTLNRFSYVLGNPILLNDPTGHIQACGVMGEACEEDGGRSGDDDSVGERSPENKDTNGNGVPDIPDPEGIVPMMNYRGATCASSMSLVECLYSGRLLPEGDITTSDEDWEKFTLALYFDVWRRAHEGDGFWTWQFDDPDAPVHYGDPNFVPFHTDEYYRRLSYDTPFFNNGGTLSGNVCFSSGTCYDRNDVNYIAEGMWSGAAGEGHIGAQYIANKWKQQQYGHDASPEVIFWTNMGVTIYQENSGIFPLVP